MPLLLDTGVLYAIADEDDDWHERARDLVEGSREVRMAPVTVLPEVAWLMAERLGPDVERRFIASVASREIMVENLTAADLHRSVEILEQYPQIGFVDSTVVAVAERLGLRSIATTDRRHFRYIRPRHCAAFELLP